MGFWGRPTYLQFSVFIAHDILMLCHHIIVRGIERRKIFVDDMDRNNFLDRTGVFLPKQIQAAMHGR